MCQIYRIFSEGYDFCDFSDSSVVELFNHESFGTAVSKNNGFFVGKKIMDITIKMWREDISECMLFKHELYASGRYPEWWLDSVLDGVTINIGKSG